MPELADLKAGDEVAIEHGYSNISYRIVKIEKVTPSGQIVVQSGLRFSSDGVELGANKFRRDRLYPITDKIRASIQRDSDISYIQRVHWKTVNNDQLTRIVAILKETEIVQQ